MRCNRVGVFAGDTSYNGWVTIWTSLREGRPRWNLAYQLQQLDEYCRFVTHVGNCTDTIRHSRVRKLTGRLRSAVVEGLR